MYVIWGLQAFGQSMSPWPSRLPHISKPPYSSPKFNLTLFSFLLAASSPLSRLSKLRASLSDDASVPRLMILSDESLLTRVSAAKDADEALAMIAEVTDADSGIVSVSDCVSIISAALDQNNSELALSVFYAMRSSFNQGSILHIQQPEITWTITQN